VEVAELRDAETVQGLRQPIEAYFQRNQFGAVGFEKRAITGNAQSASRNSCRTQFQKFSPRRKQRQLSNSPVVPRSGNVARQV
jgi:hypothetical protein